MSTCSTARRKRRTIKLDKRYKPQSQPTAKALPTSGKTKKGTIA